MDSGMDDSVFDMENGIIRKVVDQIISAEVLGFLTDVNQVHQSKIDPSLDYVKAVFYHIVELVAERQEFFLEIFNSPIPQEALVTLEFL